MMERTLSWIRENPQLAAVGFGAVIVCLALTILATAMSRGGASLRPIIWFAGFFAIVAGPQAAVHVLDGLVLARERSERKNISNSSGAEAAIAVSRTLAPVQWADVFGPKADPMLITDAKRGLAAILSDAEEAKLSFNTAGESALAARFPSPASAAAALNSYGTFFAFAQARGSDDGGWTARRHGGQGEWVHVVSAGPELYAWTGATREAVVARRVAALGPIPDDQGDGLSSESSAPSTRAVSKRLASSPAVIIGLVSLNLFAAVGWFFKGSAWAARVTPVAAVKPVSADGLNGQLLALNGRTQPIAITRATDGSSGALEVNWKYADARWFDLMRVQRMTRTHRLVLFLDESTHTVRVREFWSAWDAAAGLDGIRSTWTMNTGIQFFAVDHQRVFGAQLGADGRPTGELTHAYTFDLQSLKAPLIEVITQSGWKWQPVTWNAPAAFRWLTE